MPSSLAPLSIYYSSALVSISLSFQTTTFHYSPFSPSPSPFSYTLLLWLPFPPSHLSLHLVSHIGKTYSTMYKQCRVSVLDRKMYLKWINWHQSFNRNFLLQDIFLLLYSLWLFIKGLTVTVVYSMFFFFFSPFGHKGCASVKRQHRKKMGVAKKGGGGRRWTWGIHTQACCSRHRKVCLLLKLACPYRQTAVKRIKITITSDSSRS